MKKITILLICILLISGCEKEPKNYVYTNGRLSIIETEGCEIIDSGSSNEYLFEYDCKDKARIYIYEDNIEAATLKDLYYYFEESEAIYDKMFWPYINAGYTHNYSDLTPQQITYSVFPSRRANVTLDGITTEEQLMAILLEENKELMIDIFLNEGINIEEILEIFEYK